MADNSEFDNCLVTCSHAERDSNPYKAVWVLKDLESRKTREIVFKLAKLNLEVRNGDSRYHVQFRIGPKSSYPSSIIVNAKLIRSVPESPVSSDLRVQFLSDPLPTVITENTFHFRYTNDEIHITSIDLLKNYSAKDSDYIQNQSTVPDGDRIPVRLGFVLTPIPGNTIEPPTGARVFSNCQSVIVNLPNVPPPNQTSVFMDFGKFYLEEQDNYGDVKLESKDRVLINAHKFVLAARCHVFRKMIEMSIKENAFDGTIKITDVNANPLMALLHWIYADKLQEGTESYMQELIDAAVKFEMPELLDALDNELIKSCNVDNMLDLFKLAKQNKMETAVLQISKFIKENL